MQKTIFTEDMTNSTMKMERDFDGDLELVWQAYTDSKLLEEWWAPLPFKAVTKSQSFTEGGSWHYYMLGPDGSKFWCMLNYLTIDPLKVFTAEDVFADEDGNKNTELPGMHWTNNFTTTSTGTKVTVVIKFASNEDMQKITEMGFKEGSAMAHENLDKLLKEKK